MRLYVVVVWSSGCYSIVGIFDEAEKAIKACRTNKHGYGELKINQDLGDNPKTWPGFIYPKQHGN